MEFKYKTSKYGIKWNLKIEIDRIRKDCGLSTEKKPKKISHLKTIKFFVTITKTKIGIRTASVW